MSGGSGGPVTDASADSNVTKDRSDGSDTRTAASAGEPSGRLPFVDRHIPGQPQHRGVAQGLVGARQIEEAVAAQRELDVAHRAERHADEQAQPLSLRPDERLDDDRRGNVVRGQPRGNPQGQRGGKSERAAPHAAKYTAPV